MNQNGHGMEVSPPRFQIPLQAAGRQRQSLRAALLWLMLAALVPLVLVAAAFLWIQWDMHRTTAMEGLRQRAQTLALAVDRELGVSLAILETLAASPEIDAKDWAKFHAAAVAVLRDRPFRRIILVEPSGQQLVNTRLPYGAPLPNMQELYSQRREVEWEGRHLPSFDPRVLEPIRSGRPTVSNLFYGPLAKRPILSAAVPVLRGGRPLYVLNMGFTPDTLSALLAGERSSGTTITILVDGNGRVIARSDHSSRYLGLPAASPFDQVAVLAPEGMGKSTNLEGVPVVYAYHRLSLTGWAVVVAMPLDEIYAPVHRTFLPWFVATLLVVGLGFYLALRLQRRVVAPLTALAASAADGLQHGRMPFIPITPIQEVDTLSHALQHAAQSEKAAREELMRRLASEEQAKAAAQRAEAEVRALSAELELRVKERTTSLEDKSRQLEKMAAALQVNEARLEALVENTPAAVFMKDLEGRYVLVNRRFGQLFNRRPEDVMGKTLKDIAPPGKAMETARENERRMLAEGRPLEWEETLPAAGEQRIYLHIRFPLRDADGRIYALCGIGTDITERKRIEEEVRAARARFSGILDIAPEAIVSTDEALRITLFNKGAEETFGYRAEEVLGQSLDILVPERFREAHRRHMANFAVSDEVTRMGHRRPDVFGLRRDGTEFPAEASISKLDVGGKWLFTAMLRDITERREAEAAIEQLNGALAQRAAELEAANRELESFSYSVSHDLRAPLRSIDGFSHLLLEAYADRLDDQGREYVGRVCSSSKRMAQLIDDILALTRLSRAEMGREAVDLSALARAVADELLEQEPERDVAFSIQEGVTAVGDAQLLRVVLENLLGNAWKYTCRHPRAHIEFGTEHDGGKTVYFIRDDGAGFDMAYAGKLFGPFQRLHTQTSFPGTGVGLSSVQRIIRRHGGDVWAEGGVEAGATFRFTLGD